MKKKSRSKRKSKENQKENLKEKSAENLGKEDNLFNLQPAIIYYQYGWLKSFPQAIQE